MRLMRLSALLSFAGPIFLIVCAATILAIGIEESSFDRHIDNFGSKFRIDACQQLSDDVSCLPTPNSYAELRNKLKDRLPLETQVGLIQGLSTEGVSNRAESGLWQTAYSIQASPEIIDVLDLKFVRRSVDAERLSSSQAYVSATLAEKLFGRPD